MSGAAASSQGRPTILFSPPPYPWVPLTAIAAIVVASFAATLSTDHLVNWGGWTLTWRFIAAALHPVIDLETLKLTAASTASTVAFALCGSAINLVIGCTCGLLASEAWWTLVGSRPGRQSRPLGWLARVFRACIAVPRGIHELVWGLFLINVLGLDSLVAVLAIGIPFGAITAKVFAEMIDETPRATALRLRASGASATVSFAYGILPRALPLLLSYALYRFECAVRSAAILGLIGAGGLGYQIMLSLQSLKYQQVWTFLFALMALIGVIDWGSSRLTKRLRLQTASDGSEMRRQSRQMVIVAISVLVATIAAGWYLGLDLAKPFEPTRLAMLKRVVEEALPPRLLRGDFGVLAVLSWETLAMSIVASVLAGTAAIVVSWFATPSLLGSNASQARGRGPSIYPGTVVATLVRAELIAIRALSDGIWVLLALFIFFPGPFAGAVALAAYNFGVLGRLLSQVNETADTKPFWALRAEGASFGRAILYGLLPLTFPQYLAYILYRWEVCVRATVVVGIVGAGGLGRRLEEQMASFDYRGVAGTLIFYVALTIGVDAVSSVGRRALHLGGPTGRVSRLPTPAARPVALG